MPEVSIIIPIFKVEEYIEKTINSICNQTYKNFEIILVDDGGDDSSVDIAERILKREKMDFLIVYKSKNDQDVMISYTSKDHSLLKEKKMVARNQGLAAARNQGLAAASGKWVIFIDADDHIHPQMIEYLCYYAGKFDADFCFSSFKPVKINDNVAHLYHESFPKARVFTGDQLANLFLDRKIKIILPAVLLKREFLSINDLTFSNDCRFSEDQHFIWRMIFSTQTAVYVDARLYNYLSRPNSIMTSSSVDKMLTGYAAFLNLDTQIKHDNKILWKRKNEVLARWILGSAHACARITDYKSFCRFVCSMNYKEQMHILLRSKEFKTIASALMLLFSNRLYYLCMRHI